jgi:hypothetical protein
MTTKTKNTKTAKTKKDVLQGFTVKNKLSDFYSFSANRHNERYILSTQSKIGDNTANGTFVLFDKTEIQKIIDKLQLLIK